MQLDSSQDLPDRVSELNLVTIIMSNVKLFCKLCLYLLQGS